MKIAIKPIKQHVPGKGMVLCTEVNVNVGHYELGGPVRGNYELLTQEPPATPEGKPKDVIVTSGHNNPTAEQLAGWGTDDAYFARVVTQNAGFELA